MRYWIQIAWQYGWLPAFVLICLWLYVSISLPGIVPQEFEAMRGSLKPGKWFIVDKRIAGDGDWKRGQVVRFRPPGAVDPDRNDPWLARIVALPGDTVEVRDGKLLVGGQLVVWEGFEPQSDEQMPRLLVPADHAFLLVDQSRAGTQKRLDSRAFGMIPFLSIEGAVFGYR